MDCKEFEKRIPVFIADNMEYRELKKFLMHTEECEECKEELTIQVLISEGMIRLEEGNAFDLQKELKKRMDDAQRNLRMHKTFRNICITTVITAVLAVLLVLKVFVF